MSTPETPDPVASFAMDPTANEALKYRLAEVRGLPERVRNGMGRDKPLGALCCMRPTELLKIKNVGVQSVIDTIRVLQEHGLHMQEDPDWQRTDAPRFYVVSLKAGSVRWSGDERAEALAKARVFATNDPGEGFVICKSTTLVRVAGVEIKEIV